MAKTSNAVPKSASTPKPRKPSRRDLTKAERRPSPGRGPMERDLTLNMFGVDFFSFSMDSLGKTKTEKWWVGPKIDDAPAESKSAEGDGASADEAASGEAAAETATEPVGPAPATTTGESAPVPMFVHMKSGRQKPTSFPLDEEDLEELEELQAAIETKGAFVTAFCDMSELERFGGDPTYALDPKADDDVSLENYMVLWDALNGTTTVAFGKCYSGKTGFLYFGIYPTPEGLVMRKLPFEGEYHPIEKKIQPAWKTKTVSRPVKERMREIIRRFYQSSIIGTDLQHPKDASLRAMIAGKRLSGIRPERSPLSHINADEATQAILARPKRVAPTLELRKKKPR